MGRAFQPGGNLRLRRLAARAGALLLCAGACASAPPAPAAAPVATDAPPRRLAILQLGNDLPPDQKNLVNAEYLTDQLRERAVGRVRGVEVISRENLLVLMQGKELGECEGECEVETGRRIGADYVVDGRLVRIGIKVKLDMRLHETARGKLLASGVASGNSAEDLERVLPAALEPLLAAMRPGGDHPRVKRGMVEREVTGQLGNPVSARAVQMPHVGFWGAAGKELFFKGEMCNAESFKDDEHDMGDDAFDAGTCAVGFANQGVVYTKNVRYEFIDPSH